MYPYTGGDSWRSACRLYGENRGRRCSCTLARDMAVWVDYGMLHRKNNPSGVAKDQRFDDEVGWKKYPSLVEFLTVTQWSENEPRKPGSLNLFVDDGRLKACLTDKDANLVAFTSLASLSGCLAELEQYLLKDDLDWRKSRYDPTTGKSRKGG